MVKRTKKLPETIGELEKEIKNSKFARRPVSSDSSDSSDSPSSPNTGAISKGRVGAKRAAKPKTNPEAKQEAKPEEVNPEDKMRDDLINLSEDGDLDRSVAYLKKASKKVIAKIHAEVQKKRMDKANEFLTDLIISKWAETLGGFDAIESADNLSGELRKDPLRRDDVVRALALATPYVPLMGILSGGVTCARHVIAHRTGSNVEPVAGESQGSQVSPDDAQVPLHVVDHRE